MKKEKNKLNYKYLLLFALLQFPLKISGLRMLTYVYIYLFPFVYLIINIKWTVHFFGRLEKKIGRVVFLIFVYLIIASILWPFLTGSHDFTYITIYWRSMFLILLKNTFLAAVYEMHINKQEPSVKEFCDYYIYSVILYVLVTGICILLPSFKNFLMSIVYLEAGDITKLQIPSYRTRFGWGGWAGYGATMQCTFGVIFCCNNIILDKKNFKFQMKYFILSVLLIVGNAFYGRTGLVVSLVCISIMILISLLKKEIKYVSIIIGIIILIFFLLLSLRQIIPPINIWFEWVFSAIINYQKKGMFYDNIGTVESLMTEMYWLPDTRTLFFGDGLYTVNDNYYMGTDSGIMRPILYYGVIHYMLSIVAYALVVYQYCKRIVFEKKDSHLKKYINILFCMCIIATILFEIKGESICYLVGVICPIALLAKSNNLS